MIISGNFVAVTKRKDYLVEDEYYEAEEPDVIWFNLNNITTLRCYGDSTYYLEFDDSKHSTIELTAEAASELIKHMRKERDDKVKDKLEEMKNDPGFRDAVKFYFDHMKEDHDDNER